MKNVCLHLKNLKIQLNPSNYDEIAMKLKGNEIEMHTDAAGAGVAVSTFVFLGVIVKANNSKTSSIMCSNSSRTNICVNVIFFHCISLNLVT